MSNSSAQLLLSDARVLSPITPAVLDTFATLSGLRAAGAPPSVPPADAGPAATRHRPRLCWRMR
jgi:hypothetical protein